MKRRRRGWGGLYIIIILVVLLYTTVQATEYNKKRIIETYTLRLLLTVYVIYSICYYVTKGENITKKSADVGGECILINPKNQVCKSN